MRTLLYLTALLLLTVTAKAQWTTTTNTSGTVLYGTTNVGVVGAGTASTYLLWCGAGPYWIGNGTPLWPGPASPGSYTYSFSPAVNAIRVSATAMNSHETIEIELNGVPYVISPSEWVPWAGTCAGGTSVALIGGVIECTLDVSMGSGAIVTIYSCGINTCKVGTSGYGNGTVYTFEFNDSGTCFRAVNNGPICEGDTLKLNGIGDSIGATYNWIGPGGFTSTMKNPFRYPATMADSGNYRVIRLLGGILDTAYTHVVVKPLPVIAATSNSPVCIGAGNIIALFANPVSVGETFTWTGPNSFSSTMTNPTISGFSALDTGTYRVIANLLGCVDTAYTNVSLVAPPPAITITGTGTYCQGEPFVPFVVTGVSPGASVLWYTAGTGGTGSSVPSTINTAIPGTYTVWASQIIGSCESPRSSMSVRVITTPAAPIVTGPNQYCQFIGPIVPFTVTPATSSAVIRWYTTATGGTPLSTQPMPSVNVAGVYNYWVSQKDSTCEGPRTPVTITVHPKPAPPVVTPTPACQFWIPGQLIATPSGAGDILKWYGPGVTPGTTIAPTPSTSTAPDTVKYYVTETTIYGCVSDSAIDRQITKIKPQVPITGTAKYCQRDNAALLNELVDSAANAHLNWYYNLQPLTPTPRPFTDTIPGFYTWWVSQTIDGCEGDSVAVRIEVVYKPKFSIAVSSPWVCQFDSITLAYKGPTLFDARYKWTLPKGAVAVQNTDTEDSMIYVRFDSVNLNNFVVKLRAGIDSGFCFSDTTTTIKVVPQPTMHTYTKPDVCLGDTVQLSLNARSANAYAFTWLVDNVKMTNSTALNIVSANSSSGGPFLISWADTGKHVITVTTVSQEGCKSAPAYDSVYVHNIPDATFRVISSRTTLCLEDSVEFSATSDNYNYMYTWAPSRYFDNINKPTIWGKMGDEHSVVTLTVTDPYGCYATQSLQVDAGTCCTIALPNAFTPNGDNVNNVFRPYYSGYHRFHVFRIVNRWGQTVFDAANTSDAAWDGNYNGVPQDMGVYFYIIKYDCGGKTIEQKGDITLIR